MQPIVVIVRPHNAAADDAEPGPVGPYRSLRRTHAALASFQTGRAAGLVLLLALSGSMGCGSVQTQPPLFASLDVPVTLTEFRMRTNDFTEFFVAVIEDAADVIIEQAEDEDVRRHAMVARLRVVTAFLDAVSQPDPAASLVDVWAFCLQLQDFVTDGAGRDVFGEDQEVVIAATDMIVAEVENVVASVAGGEGAPVAAGFVRSWADEHPITVLPFARGTSAVELAEQMERQDGGPFAALGRLQTGVDDVVEQMQRYLGILPRTVRWQAQLILHQTLYDEPRIVQSLDSLDAVTAGLLEMNAFVQALPGDLRAAARETLEELGPYIENERARLLGEIDAQRRAVFEDIDRERTLVMAELERQTAMVQGELDADIDDVLDNIEALTAGMISESADEGERLMDLVYRRALVLLLIAIAGGAGLIVLARWKREPAATQAPRSLSGAED